MARVAIVMPLAEQRGGGELMLWHLLSAAESSAHEYSVIFLEDGPMVQRVRDLSIPASVIRAGRLRTLARYVSTVTQLAWTLRKGRINLVVGWMGKAQLYSGPAALLARVPAIWYQLGLPEDRNGIDRLATAIPARGVVTLSRVAEAAQRQLWPHRPTWMVYPAVELDRFDPENLPSPEDARRALRLPADGPLIGTVGRLQRWKGMHVLVDAMPAILSAHPEARCVIVGGPHDREPDYLDLLQERIAAQGVRDRVILAGAQSNAQLWMQAMDVFVHASDREPFGIVIVEAMALGKPVVAGCEGGPAEIIADGVNGLLSPYGDAGRLAAAIDRCLSDPAFAARLGASARERALEFSVARYARELGQVFETAGHRGPAWKRRAPCTDSGSNVVRLKEEGGRR